MEKSKFLIFQIEKEGVILRNNITIDLLNTGKCDCKCIISENDGANTLELFIQNADVDSIIVTQWTDEKGTTSTKREIGKFLDTGELYYLADLTIFTRNNLVKIYVESSEKISETFSFQCVNISDDTNFTVTHSGKNSYRVAASETTEIKLATTTSPGIVQVGYGLKIDESGVLSVDEYAISTNACKDGIKLMAYGSQSDDCYCEQIEIS